MTTYWEIYEKFALANITDLELNDLFETNPAQFGIRMEMYMLNGIALFTRPELVQDLLADREDAKVDNLQTILEEPTKSLNTEKKGFDKVNATYIKGVDEDTDMPIIENLPLSYNKETGEIVFVEEQPIGTDIDIDFYKDGYFNQDLNLTEKRILGRCIQESWENKFMGREIDRMLIIEDRQTKVANQANRSNSLTQRFEVLSGVLQAEMQRYEDSCAMNTLPMDHRIPLKRN